MTDRIHNTPVRRPVSIAILCLIACGAACNKVRPTPAPKFQSVERATPMERDDYIAGLKFDGSTLIPDTARFSTPYGPSTVIFESEVGAAGIADDDVPRGRVIGRARTIGAPSRFGTPEGHAYVWIDSAATGWRWIWIFPGGRIDTTVYPTSRGSQAYVAGNRTGFELRIDTMPNGRCGRYCCPFMALMPSSLRSQRAIDSLLSRSHRPP